MELFGRQEFPAPQNPQGSLDGALGKPGGFRHVPQAFRYWPPPTARRQSIQVQINYECGRVFVMADQITQ
jgi:hypothetical protein